MSGFYSPRSGVRQEETGKNKLLNACHLLSASNINELSVSCDLSELCSDRSYNLYFEKIFENRDSLKNNQEIIKGVLLALIAVFKKDLEFNLEDTKRQWINSAMLQDKYFSDLSPTSSAVTFFSRGDSEEQEEKFFASPKPKPHIPGKRETLAVQIWQQAEPEINRLLGKTVTELVAPSEALSSSVPPIPSPS